MIEKYKRLSEDGMLKLEVFYATLRIQISLRG